MAVESPDWFGRLERTVKAVLITGNPKYIGTPLAKAYYKSIVEFVEHLGVSCTIDPGREYTCPPKADFYIAHSRGVDRFRCVADHPVMSKRFIRFGDVDGINHPVDSEWLKTQVGSPPPEHFYFVEEQKEAIRKMVAAIGQKQGTAFKW